MEREKLVGGYENVLQGLLRLCCGAVMRLLNGYSKVWRNFATVVSKPLSQTPMCGRGIWFFESLICMCMRYGTERIITTTTTTNT